jgi:hypothetical protein
MTMRAVAEAVIAGGIGEAAPGEAE